MREIEDMKNSPKCTLLVLFLPFLLILSCVNFVAAEDQDFYQLQSEIEKSFDNDMNSLESEWDAFDTAQFKEWERYKYTVEQKWQNFVSSTKKTWVEYDENLDTRSSVDFENGTIEIEAVLEDDDKGSVETAKKKIVDQIKSIFNKAVNGDEPVLKDQVHDKNGKPVAEDDVDEFVTKEITSQIKPDLQSYKSRDGEQRLRYSVTIKMVPEHIDIRARKYVQMVELNAKRFNLDPKLLMAVIHTESYFNPMAKSTAGAYGLMQVIPRFAGREAYQYIYETDWIIQPDYLYSPGINIELGAAYLYILQNRYFKDINDDEKRLYVSICAYNWGPTAMRKKILDKNHISQMTAVQVYALLQKNTPEETRNYLKRVSQRMEIYQAYFI